MEQLKQEVAAAVQAWGDGALTAEAFLGEMRQLGVEVQCAPDALPALPAAQLLQREDLQLAYDSTWTSKVGPKRHLDGPRQGLDRVRPLALLSFVIKGIQDMAAAAAGGPAAGLRQLLNQPGGPTREYCFPTFSHKHNSCLLFVGQDRS